MRRNRMNRMNRQQILFYVIIGLIAIGIISLIVRNPGAAVIPVAVFGIVFLLYKFPPDRWRGWLHNFRARMSGTGSGRGGKRNVKKAKFRVISGNKPDRDDPPRYH